MNVQHKLNVLVRTVENLQGLTPDDPPLATRVTAQELTLQHVTKTLEQLTTTVEELASALNRVTSDVLTFYRMRWLERLCWFVGGPRGYAQLKRLFKRR